AHAARGQGAADALRHRNEHRPHAGGGRQAVRRDTRADTSDRSQGAAQAAPPEPFGQAEELPRISGAAFFLSSVRRKGVLLPCPARPTSPPAAIRAWHRPPDPPIVASRPPRWPRALASAIGAGSRPSSPARKRSAIALSAQWFVAR